MFANELTAARRYAACLLLWSPVPLLDSVVFRNPPIPGVSMSQIAWTVSGTVKPVDMYAVTVRAYDGDVAPTGTTSGASTVVETKQPGLLFDEFHGEPIDPNESFEFTIRVRYVGDPGPDSGWMCENWVPSGWFALVAIITAATVPLRVIVRGVSRTQTFAIPSSKDLRLCGRGLCSGCVAGRV